MQHNSCAASYQAERYRKARQVHKLCLGQKPTQACTADNSTSEAPHVAGRLQPCCSEQLLKHLPESLPGAAVKVLKQRHHVTR